MVGVASALADITGFKEFKTPENQDNIFFKFFLKNIFVHLFFFTSFLFKIQNAGKSGKYFFQIFLKNIFVYLFFFISFLFKIQNAGKSGKYFFQIFFEKYFCLPGFFHFIFISIFLIFNRYFYLFYFLTLSN